MWVGWGGGVGGSRVPVALMLFKELQAHPGTQLSSISHDVLCHRLCCIRHFQAPRQPLGLWQAPLPWSELLLDEALLCPCRQAPPYAQHISLADNLDIFGEAVAKVTPVRIGRIVLV